MPTIDEKYNAISLIDIESVIKPVCEICSANEDCCGCLSHHCPFAAQLSDVIDHAYDMEEALLEAIDFAKDYQEYCNDMEVDIHRPSHDVA